MTKGQRTIVSLLAAVAVLLGLNLIVGGSTPAAAQVAAGPVQPTVISVSSEQIWRATGGTSPSIATRDWRIVRGWSDGQVDVSRATFESEQSCVLLPSSCPPEVFIPGACREDVNSDLTVNVLDLIDLLLAFGTACP